MKKFLFGCAYYTEYMPVERLEKDLAMMEKAGLNTIRIAESTWSTWEPEDGLFNFETLIRVLDAAKKHHINVIVGTPTYAIPSWMSKKYPDIMVTNRDNTAKYGHRQTMDITEPHYLFYCERIIRKILEITRKYKCVIGYQLDNETKSYDNYGSSFQAAFVKELRSKYSSTDAMNQELGLSYWSNSIYSWDDFPDMRGCVNESLIALYRRFQRASVTSFLQWQAQIVRQYLREDQFITHNYDYEWRDYSYGLQPDVDQFESAATVTVAGADIYHPSNSKLTGAEINICGAISRALKKAPYIVMETEAQGNMEWLPYPGQLRLQAYSHIANGACGVMYWHWHSIHNSVESYWKGILSHNLKENVWYREIAGIGSELDKLSSLLEGAVKKNKVAVMLSNEALTGIDLFPVKDGPSYNDTVRWVCDALYKLNIEFDIVNHDEVELSKYTLLCIPTLYSASEKDLQNIKDYVAAGGHIFATYRTAFANEELKIWHDDQPHMLTECFGMTYDSFTLPDNVNLSGYRTPVTGFMELLRPITAHTWDSYDNKHFDGYSAITYNTYEKGTAVYAGCGFSEEVLMKVLSKTSELAGIVLPEAHYPVIVKKCVNKNGKQIVFVMNYSDSDNVYTYRGETLREYFSGNEVKNNDQLTVRAWDVLILVPLQ